MTCMAPDIDSAHGRLHDIAAARCALYYAACRAGAINAAALADYLTCHLRAQDAICLVSLSRSKPRGNRVKCLAASQEATA